MGNGITLLSAASQRDPNLLQSSREEISSMFAEAYSSLKNEDVSREEAEQIFLERLRNKEAELLQNISSRHTDANKDAAAREQRELRLDAFHHRSASSMLRQKGMTFLCCVDGSDSSDAAFKTVLHIRKKYDHICIFHTFKESKMERLDPRYQPSAIRQRYESQLISICTEKYYSFHFEERYNRSVLSVLRDLFSLYTSVFSQTLTPTQNYPDFVVIGHYGCKGPKDKRSSLGSNAMLALRALPCPVIIAKRPVSAGARYFVMAVDFSSQSMVGLDILLTIVSPRDTLRLIFIRHRSDSTEDLSNTEYYHYCNELQENGPTDSAFTILDVADDIPVEEAILGHIHGPHMPDFLAIAPRQRANEVSHLTEYIVMNSSVSVILCKN